MSLGHWSAGSDTNDDGSGISTTTGVPATPAVELMLRPMLALASPFSLA